MEESTSKKDLLIGKIEDEYTGFLSYLDMTEEFTDYEKYFVAMAVQELEHAETLEEIADDMNMCIADDKELEEIRKKAEEKYNSL